MRLKAVSVDAVYLVLISRVILCRRMYGYSVISAALYAARPFLVGLNYRLCWTTGPCCTARRDGRFYGRPSSRLHYEAGCIKVT